LKQVQRSEAMRSPSKWARTTKWADHAFWSDAFTQLVRPFWEQHRKAPLVRRPSAFPTLAGTEAATAAAASQPIDDD
jgi:hypothetical protein